MANHSVEGKHIVKQRKKHRSDVFTRSRESRSKEDGHPIFENNPAKANPGVFLYQETGSFSPHANFSRDYDLQESPL